MDVRNRDVDVAYVVGAILLVITGWLYYENYRPEWKSYQTEFRRKVTERFGGDRARQIPAGLQQIWVPELNRVDRCVTCHQATEWSGFETAPEPYRTHPQAILKNHPLEKYGCTICHGGEGYATGLATAHATLSEHWDEPLLYGELAKAYNVDSPRAMLEINCNGCHRYDKVTEGADHINMGKQLVDQKLCVVCHKINGQGGNMAPDLTEVGDRAAEHYDYSNVQGSATVFNWHLAHFKNPKEVSPNTLMPNFALSEKETQALAILVMSWRHSNLPAAYIPAPKAPPPTQSATQAGPASK
jgi:cytochrome c2